MAPASSSSVADRPARVRWGLAPPAARLFLFVVAAWPFIAAGDARADQVSVEVSSKVHVGATPALTLKLHADVERARLELAGKPRGRVDATQGPGARGGTLVFPLPQKEVGVVRWTGSLAVTFADGSSGTMPLAFATEVRGAIRLEVLSDKAELEQHQVRVRMDQPAGAVDVEVLGEDGELLASQSTPFQGEAPGTELVARWVPKRDVPILRVRVTGRTPDGFYSPSVDKYPWSLMIPHEEVHFETGKSAVLPTEEPKLLAVLPEVKRAIARYGKLVSVKLFILGHTDTVGSAASNRALSEARAHAIAAWFKRQGVSVPIYARGFGEDALKVSTPDETPSAENRRADYLLHVEGPYGGLAGWRRVN